MSYEGSLQTGTKVDGGEGSFDELYPNSTTIVFYILHCWNNRSPEVSLAERGATMERPGGIFFPNSSSVQRSSLFVLFYQSIFYLDNPALTNRCILSTTSLSTSSCAAYRNCNCTTTSGGSFRPTVHWRKSSLSRTILQRSSPNVFTRISSAFRARGGPTIFMFF